jgi:hypothetical protein
MKTTLPIRLNSEDSKSIQVDTDALEDVIEKADLKTAPPGAAFDSVLTHFIDQSEEIKNSADILFMLAAAQEVFRRTAVPIEELQGDGGFASANDKILNQLSATLARALLAIFRKKFPTIEVSL